MDNPVTSQPGSPFVSGSRPCDAALDGWRLPVEEAAKRKALEQTLHAHNVAASLHAERFRGGRRSIAVVDEVVDDLHGHRGGEVVRVSICSLLRSIRSPARRRWRRNLAARLKVLSQRLLAPICRVQIR